MRNIVIIREADMMQSVLYSDGASASDRRLKTMLAAIEGVVNERTDYEAKLERKKDGVIQVAQSPDIRFAQALANNEAVARMFIALKVNPRSYIFPQSQADGKSSNETSNLKSYEKVRQIAETIFHGSSDLQKVAKVFAVCAYQFAKKGNPVLTREYCESFLNSRELANLDSATAQLWSDIDDIRVKEMSGGAPTQSGQMVRSLVALKGGVDIKNGKHKDFELFPESPIVQALMMRLGQIEVTAS